MRELMPKSLRRITVGLTSAALVATSFGMAGLTAAPAAAQGLRAGLAPMATHQAAPEDVQMRQGANPRARGPGKGWSGPRPGARPHAPRWSGPRPGVRPGYGRPGMRPGYPGYGRPGVRPPRPGWHARWGQPYWRNNGWYYRNNNGAWVAAGIAGLALGAAAGAAAANAAGNDAVSYCSQRFRSYNPATGTYTGYDGRQHPCP